MENLPRLYQTHLENKLKPSEFLFFNILINILQNIKEISLEIFRLAATTWKVAMFALSA